MPQQIIVIYFDRTRTLDQFHVLSRLSYCKQDFVFRLLCHHKLHGLQIQLHRPQIIDVDTDTCQRSKETLFLTFMSRTLYQTDLYARRISDITIRYSNPLFLQLCHCLRQIFTAKSKRMQYSIFMFSQRLCLKLRRIDDRIEHFNIFIRRYPQICQPVVFIIGIVLAQLQHILELPDL